MKEGPAPAADESATARDVLAPFAYLGVLDRVGRDRVDLGGEGVELVDLRLERVHGERQRVHEVVMHVLGLPAASAASAEAVAAATEAAAATASVRSRAPSASAFSFLTSRVDDCCVFRARPAAHFSSRAARRRRRADQRRRRRRAGA